MIKTGVFRSQLPGSTILFTLVISFNSGTLASIKIDPAFSPNLIQPKILAMLFYYNGNLADTAVGAVQIASTCGYKHLLWEDMEYPCLIE
jgi:hypothetical protein